MKRSTLAALSFLSIPLLAAAALPASAASAASQASSQAHVVRASAESYNNEPLCSSKRSLCVDSQHYPYGKYVGHDEPSLEFKSNLPGSGNDMTYTMTLPRDPKTQPNASGAGGTTWNFQLRPAFWFGMTLCDSQSAPEFTTNCTPDSDKNNLVSSNPNSPKYIGKHPGNAFMELQFYGPGSVPQFEGFGCTATQYCAAMTIDSRTLNQNTGVENTNACNNYVLGGAEPINWAYITKSGVSQAPANPLFTGTFTNPNFTAVNPNPAEDLFMSPGDTIRIHLHDTPAGLRADLTDLTTGQHGSMTASIANGFGHILYTPNSSTCQEAPYAFHPEYSTANVRGNTWSAAHVQHRHVRRDRPLRELPGDRPDHRQLHLSGRPGRDHRGLGRHGLPPGYRLVAGEDQRVHRLGRGLGRAVLPAGLARHEPEPGRGPGPAPHTGAVHQPADPRAGTTRPSPSRPTCRASKSRARRPTRHSAT